jgi:hypothetical protein
LLHKNFKDKTQITENDIPSMFFAFLNRSRLDYKTSHIKEYFCNCLCLKDKKKMRHLKGLEAHFLFDKAETKLKNELDVVRLVKTMRKFKALAEAMLSQKHRLLLKF